MASCRDSSGFALEGAVNHGSRAGSKWLSSFAWRSRFNLRAARATARREGDLWKGSSSLTESSLPVAAEAAAAVGNNDTLRWSATAARKRGAASRSSTSLVMLRSNLTKFAMTFASRSSTMGSSGASAWRAECSSGRGTKASCFFSCRSRPLVSLWFLCDRMGEETGLRRVRGGNEAASREAAREA